MSMSKLLNWVIQQIWGHVNYSVIYDKMWYNNFKVK